MTLWWLVTSNSECSYEELKRRECIALRWRELESIQRYIKPGNNWERRFKTFIQLRGNIAYSRGKHWNKQAQDMDNGVPSIFWKFLHIQQGDYIVAMESGSQLTLGQLEVQGFAQVTQDSMSSYQFNEDFHHSHEVCHGLHWYDWSIPHFGELQKPLTSFMAIHRDNDQLGAVQNAWQAAEQNA